MHATVAVFRDRISDKQKGTLVYISTPGKGRDSQTERKADDGKSSSSPARTSCSEVLRIEEGGQREAQLCAITKNVYERQTEKSIAHATCSISKTQNFIDHVDKYPKSIFTKTTRSSPP